MTIVGWIVFGLIAGVLAKLLLMPESREGIIVTMMLGIAGALVGGVFGRGFGWYQDNDPGGFFMVMLGAMLALVIYRQLAEASEVGHT